MTYIKSALLFCGTTRIQEVGLFVAEAAPVWSEKYGLMNLQKFKKSLLKMKQYI